jgi:ABC-type sulfate transport system permease subunit
MAQTASRSPLSVGRDAVDDLSRRTGFAESRIMNTVRVIGGAMIGLAVLVVVLNQVFTLDSISNGSGPFQDVITSLESTGAAALSLLVIGLLVLGANRVMGFFGSGGF